MNCTAELLVDGLLTHDTRPFQLWLHAALLIEQGFFLYSILQLCWSVSRWDSRATGFTMLAPVDRTPSLCLLWLQLSTSFWAQSFTWLAYRPSPKPQMACCATVAVLEGCF